MVRNSKFGRLFKLPKNKKKSNSNSNSKKYLTNCKPGEDEYNQTKSNKKIVSNTTGWWFKFNKRVLKKKSKKKKCVK